MRKVVEAKLAGENKLVVWGTGRPRREFLYSDDLADACLHLLNLPEAIYDPLVGVNDAPLINVGTGEDITIRELAELVARVLDFDCQLAFDTSKQDGTPQKLLDVSRIRGLGWSAKVSLEEGIRRTYAFFQSQLQSANS
jgi:GDP-L-fucose synthase